MQLHRMLYRMVIACASGALTAEDNNIEATRSRNVLESFSDCRTFQHTFSQFQMAFDAGQGDSAISLWSSQEHMQVGSDPEPASLGRLGKG